MRVSLKVLWGLFDLQLSDESDAEPEQKELQSAVAGFALDTPAEFDEDEDGADPTE